MLAAHDHRSPNDTCVAHMPQKLLVPALVERRKLGGGRARRDARVGSYGLYDGEGLLERGRVEGRGRGGMRRWRKEEAREVGEEGQRDDRAD